MTGFKEELEEDYRGYNEIDDAYIEAYNIIFDMRSRLEELKNEYETEIESEFHLAVGLVQEVAGLNEKTAQDLCMQLNKLMSKG